MRKVLLAIFLFSSLAFGQDLLKRQSELVSEGKGVILIFESDTCSYCSLLKKDFIENKEMNELAKEFNIYLINKEKEQDYIVGEAKKKETTTTLRMAFAVKNIPNIIIFDKHWNRIFQVPGYADPLQMIVFMKFVKGLHDGKYDTKDWQKYLEENNL